MSFYPIVDDESLLRELDGWLLRTIHTSLLVRAQIFRAGGQKDLPQPHGLAKAGLLTFLGRTSEGEQLDLRVPSFLRMAKLIRHASSVFGANSVADPRSLYGTPQGRKISYPALV